MCKPHERGSVLESWFDPHPRAQARCLHGRAACIAVGAGETGNFPFVLKNVKIHVQFIV
jgi:hypothetical protein